MDLENMTNKLQIVISAGFLRLESVLCNKIVNKCIFWSILCAVGILMFILNSHTPIIADDFWSAFGPNGRITGVQDCWQAVIHDYFSWGSGILCFFFQHLFMAYDQHVFDIVNSVVFCSLVYVLYLFVVGNFKEYRISLLLIIVFVLFIFPPNFGQNFLWLVGSTAYLWIPLISLIYLLPLRWQFNQNTQLIKKPFISVIYGLLGIIAANTNANLSAAMVALFGLNIFWNLLNKKCAYFWIICAFVGTFIGFCTVLFSPGNATRATGEYESVNFIYNLVATTFHLFDWNVFLPILLFSLSMLALQKVKLDSVIMLLIGGLFLSHYAMVGAPCYSDRVKVIPLYFGAILCGYIYHKLNIDTIRKKSLVYICMICMFVGIAHSLRKASYDILAYEQDNAARVEYILSQKALGVENVEVSTPYVPTSKYNGAYDLENVTSDPNHWVSSAYAHYYGVKSVKTIN